MDNDSAKEYTLHESSPPTNKNTCLLFVFIGPGRWRSGSRTEGWKRRSWKKRCFSTTQHTTSFDEGRSKKDQTSCITNILKHRLNNNFFFEFIMHISLWDHVNSFSWDYSSVCLRPFLWIVTVTTCIFSQKLINKRILFIFLLMLGRTVIICTKSNLVPNWSHDNFIKH